ncbi:MAG: hypothetical protein ACRD0H_30740, partial [Actinomycetes bacterium]
HKSGRLRPAPEEMTHGAAVSPDQQRRAYPTPTGLGRSRLDPGASWTAVIKLIREEDEPPELVDYLNARGNQRLVASAPAGSTLSAFVTYDKRLADRAGDLGVAIAAPGQAS